ncbi:DUF4214 domain-containing protein [uncultured Marivita sp.]|jgi:hypothetical protein|uniref:DUF4214 domain-containing protein n=1 Tax=uncultured Marivita sp. TaxID=888080 RepID=UPI0025F8681C|nr:DUF4214 domain-containing protein [uncultured Marivita sp.]MCR9111548.1 DUF4214 domain-containing protein [Paracoccaceae bacterium]
MSHINPVALFDFSQYDALRVVTGGGTGGTEPYESFASTSRDYVLVSHDASNAWFAGAGGGNDVIDLREVQGGNFNGGPGSDIFILGAGPQGESFGGTARLTIGFDPAEDWIIYAEHEKNVLLDTQNIPGSDDNVIIGQYRFRSDDSLSVIVERLIFAPEIGGLGPSGWLENIGDSLASGTELTLPRDIIPGWSNSNDAGQLTGNNQHIIDLGYGSDTVAVFATEGGFIDLGGDDGQLPVSVPLPGQNLVIYEGRPATPDGEQDTVILSSDARGVWNIYAIDTNDRIVLDGIPGVDSLIDLQLRAYSTTTTSIEYRLTEELTLLTPATASNFIIGDGSLTSGSEVNVVLEGTPASDILVSGRDSDTISGLSGNDTLTGGLGDDFLDGGSGIDTAVYSGNQNSYSLTLNPSSVTIVDRRGDGNGTDTLVDIELLNFDTDLLGSPFDLTNFGGLAGLSSSDFESFIELYIAYFNRSPDAVGLNFWGTAFANGTSLEQMATLFVDQDETRATYPEGTSNTDFVTAVYNNVLGRIPDQDGFDFWIDMLNRSAETGVTRDQFILEVLRGVQDGSSDRSFLDSKVDIGAYFAVHRGMSDVDNASAAMALFDGSQTSIDQAVAAIDGFYQDALDPTNGEFLMQVVGVLDNPFAA